MYTCNNYKCFDSIKLYMMWSWSNVYRIYRTSMECLPTPVSAPTRKKHVYRICRTSMECLPSPVSAPTRKNKEGRGEEEEGSCCDERRGGPNLSHTQRYIGIMVLVPVTRLHASCQGATYANHCLPMMRMLPSSRRKLCGHPGPRAGHDNILYFLL